MRLINHYLLSDLVRIHYSEEQIPEDVKALIIKEIEDGVEAIVYDIRSLLRDGMIGEDFYDANDTYFDHRRRLHFEDTYPSGERSIWFEGECKRPRCYECERLDLIWRVLHLRLTEPDHFHQEYSIRFSISSHGASPGFESVHGQKDLYFQFYEAPNVVMYKLKKPYENNL